MSMPKPAIGGLEEDQLGQGFEGGDVSLCPFGKEGPPASDRIHVARLCERGQS